MDIKHPPFPRFSRCLLEVGNDGGWVVAENFEVEYQEGAIEVIRPGFRTDLLSAPFFVRPIIRTWGRWTKPAVYHDWCYEHRNHSRKEADRRFYEGLVALGVGKAKSLIMYSLVRTFGWYRWYW